MKFSRSVRTGSFFFLMLCLIISSFWIFSHDVLSQEEAGVSISPVTFELNADPGDMLTNQIKIYNSTDFPQTVRMKVEDFTPVGEEGQVVLEEPDEGSTYSLAKWTIITPTEFTLPSRTQQLVTFVIQVPHNGEPGGHYGSIVAEVSGGHIEDGAGTSVATKRGALLLLRVSGNIVEEIQVETFSAKSFQEFGPVDFDLKFENTGNVHLRPAGFITITDMFGKQVAQIEIPQNNVIPGAIRQSGVTWDERNLVGKYTATIVANYGSTSKETITAVTSFTVFPWKKALALGIIILGLIFILIRARKRIGLALKVLAGKH